MNHVQASNCDILLGSLSEYLDGELRDEVCRELERHLAECEHCRVIVDTTRKAIYLVHVCAKADEACPEDVRARLYERLNLDDLLSKAKK